MNIAGPERLGVAQPDRTARPPIVRDGQAPRLPPNMMLSRLTSHGSIQMPQCSLGFPDARDQAVEARQERSHIAFPPILTGASSRPPGEHGHFPPPGALVINPIFGARGVSSLKMPSKGLSSSINN
jgi:hypothetical protein